MKFDSKWNMKDKVYLNDCQVGDRNHQLVIIIIHDEYIFSTNNDGKIYR